jgi:ketosteroid isomerase-like protein
MKATRAKATAVMKIIKCAAALAAAGIGSMGISVASVNEDMRIVAALDRQFQLAVKCNDADTMANIMHEQMVLVLSDGRVNTREEQLEEARSKTLTYEIQDEDPGSQTVRVYGDTAVVTALLRIKGTKGGQPFARHLWFSDTYVRTPQGWRYFIGQVGRNLFQT